VEVLVVMVGIVVLLALLVIKLQKSREESRRSMCNGWLRNIALGLQSYHDVYKVFPMGAMHSGANPGGEPPIVGGLGPSWCYGIMQCIDSNLIYDSIANTQRLGAEPNIQFCAQDINAEFARRGWRRKVSGPYYFRCPSSPVPEMETPTGPICLTSYVGIAGGCDIDPTSEDYRVIDGSVPRPVQPKTAKIYHNTHKGTGAAAGGIVTSSGMLPPCQHVRLADCSDGTSNTMIVAEQSDWLLDRNPASSNKYHGDPGWTVGGTGAGGGWLSGTRRVDPIPQVDTPGGPPAPWGADCWNIATVRYPPNFKRVMGTTPLPGCSENHGINNPLQSPHPGGLLVAMVDGSVEFISDKIDLEVLLRLAIRDDGVSPVRGSRQ
jgi:hypothetical protein